jgi:hypothetical protein
MRSPCVESGYDISMKSEADGLWVPGVRIIGGRRVRCVPGSVRNGEKGTLAEPLKIRGVVLPAGTRIVVDSCDTDAIGAELRQVCTIYGLDLPAGTSLSFRSRHVGFAGLNPGLLGLLVPLVALWTLTSRLLGGAAQARDREVWIRATDALVLGGLRIAQGEYVIVRADGTCRRLSDREE